MVSILAAVGLDPVSAKPGDVVALYVSCLKSDNLPLAIVIDLLKFAVPETIVELPDESRPAPSAQFLPAIANAE